MKKQYYFLSAEPPILVAHSPSPPQETVLVLSKHKHILGALIIVTVVLSVATSLCLFFRRKLFPYFFQRWKHKGNLKNEELSLRRFGLEELEKATKNFSEECLLGSGAFGNVYKGTFDVEGILAIKRAHNDSCQSVEEFRNGGRKAKVLVYEYVPNGSLLEYITRNRGRSLTWRQRVNIAIGAAKGIAHLHNGVTPSIIHRDIKPSNILVGSNFEAKVSDFGLVKLGPIGDQSHVSSQIKGTPGYLDPAYCSSFHLSPFSDVYSFGVILLQLVSARPAVDSSRNQSNYHIIEWARPSLDRGNVAEILDANLLTETCNMEIMLKMGKLGLRCVVQNPKNRPTMTQVWQEIEEALYLADNFIYKEPSRRSRSSSGYQQNNHGRQRLIDWESSQSFVSIDGVGFQRFRIEMDSPSFESVSLRCFEASTVSIDIDNNNLK
ncbi:serine-threonine protein kinase, plant-type, putative [Ricinus communis]|uniref:Serine-threonine protein kinase, plant-type, putative n=1 Tax=Ricinus communis TaxID=3988 RepID=B9SXB1_RICCO|nr:serine-threonine protein kinase, plant-type, putative [Ricinus communis]